MATGLGAMLALQLLKTRERRESEGGSSFSESSASSHRPPAVEAFSSMQMGFQRLFWKEAVGKRDVSSIYRCILGRESGFSVLELRFSMGSRIHVPSEALKMWWMPPLSTTGRPAQVKTGGLRLQQSYNHIGRRSSSALRRWDLGFSLASKCRDGL